MKAFMPAAVGFFAAAADRLDDAVDGPPSPEPLSERTPRSTPARMSRPTTAATTTRSLPDGRRVAGSLSCTVSGSGPAAAGAAAVRPSTAVTGSGAAWGARTGAVAEGTAAPPRKSFTWAIDQRRPGSRTIVPSRSGAIQPASASCGGSSWTMRYIAASTLSPISYGGRPDSAWKAVAPNDHTSLAASPAEPVATSGARYAGEPVTRPVWVNDGSPVTRAMPKS